MAIVCKIDGAWQALSGVMSLVRVGESYSDCTILYRDGRQEVVPCDPYPVRDMVDLTKIEQLVAEGVWGDADLDIYGLKLAVPFVVPEGKKRHSGPTYVEKKGVVSEVYEVDDAPPPPPEPTTTEKLAALGLTRDDLRELLGSEE